MDLKELPDGIRLMIFDQLIDHDRFLLWTGCNYALHVRKNDEEERVEVKVQEQDLAHAHENLTSLAKEMTDKAKDQIQVVGADMLDKLPKG